MVTIHSCPWLTIHRGCCHKLSSLKSASVQCLYLTLSKTDLLTFTSVSLITQSSVSPLTQSSIYRKLTISFIAGSIISFTSKSTTSVTVKSVTSLTMISVTSLTMISVTRLIVHSVTFIPNCTISFIVSSFTRSMVNSVSFITTEQSVSLLVPSPGSLLANHSLIQNDANDQTWELMLQPGARVNGVNHQMWCRSNGINDQTWSDGANGKNIKHDLIQLIVQLSGRT